MDRDYDYAITLTGPVADLDAFEDVLDALPEARLVSGVGYGPTADLVFIVDAGSSGRGPRRRVGPARRRSPPVRDGAVLGVRLLP